MNILLYSLFFYAILLSILYFQQEKLIFFPEKLTSNYNFQLPPYAKDLSLKTSDGLNISAILFSQPENKTIIIYFHGNGGSLSSWKSAGEELFAMGCNVLIIDYRGYGKSNGVFSESGLYMDGEAAYDYVTKLGYTNKNIIFYGTSLGSGIAVEMAIRHPGKGLILEAPFISLTKAAMKNYWFIFPKLLLRYQFDNINKVSKLTMPVLLIHGSDDEVIPVSHSQVLNEAIKTPHTLTIIPNAIHNNLRSFPEHAIAIKKFLASLH